MLPLSKRDTFARPYVRRAVLNFDTEIPEIVRRDQGYL